MKNETRTALIGRFALEKWPGQHLMAKYLKTILLGSGLITPLWLTPVYAGQGVTERTIRIAGVMDLKGRSQGLGNGMKKGIEAAIKNQRVKNRRLEFIALNDSYTPSKTIESTHKLIDNDVLLFAGNVGTPTAKVSLPILKENRIPAVGFFTGAGLLRPGDGGPILNYRASYIQETAKVIKEALKHGIRAPEICAYVQNDAYGMAGAIGIQKALENQPGSTETLKAINKIINMTGENPPRNGIGPVGVYQRNSYLARPGYDSLKAWEKKEDVQCKLIVTVGSYMSIAKFIGYASYKGEKWVYSAVSFTGADNFKIALNDMNVQNRVIMTQVVPLKDSDLPIVKEAKLALGDDFGYVSLEGYIVGRLLLKGLQDIKGNTITREKFMKSIKGKRFDLGGLSLDFTRDNQGSDRVFMTALSPDGWHSMNTHQWSSWF